MPPGSVVLLSGEPRRCEMPAQSGAAIIREFCERCGTHLFSASAAYPAFKTVKIGALDEPGAIAPVAHFWTDRLIDWAEMDDGLPRFAGNVDMAELERLWRESRGT
jgi:hypothetical protein